MRRATVNFIVNLVSFVVLLGLSVSGFILMIPHHGQGFRGGRGPVETSEFLGLNGHEIGEAHQWLGIIFVVLMLVHLVLHWDWVKCYVKSIFSGAAGEDCRD
jgi:hypothetical protein